MKKKQIIGLGTLLLVLLLGLFTTSYANSYRDFTETELKNILYKAWINAGHSETDVINSITTHENNGNITTVVNALNNTNNCIISFDTGSTGWNECIISCYNSLSNTHPYFYNGRISFKNSPSGNMYKLYYNGSYSTASIYYYYESRTDYIYYGDTFYNSGSGTTVTHAANTYTPSTFFDEWYYQDALPFTFIPKPADEYADVFYFEDIPLYNASGEDLYLGQLYQPNVSNVVYWTKDNYYYRYGDWNMRQLPVDSIYLEYFTSDENGSWYDVYLQSKYIYENTIYSTVLADGSSEPYTLAYTNFYIKNNYTSVVNGVINPSQTFSGDYKDKYDNDLDNQQDVNNISEAIGDTILDDSEVDNMLSGFNSSGDILDSLGYSPIENPFTTVILDVITQLTDVLLGSGNVTLDISAFDLEMVLHSESFTLPNGLIKIFVSLVSNGFMIWIIYKYGFKLYMEINTGKFKNLIDETTNTNINLF